MTKNQMITMGLAFENKKNQMITLDTDRLSMYSKENIQSILADVKSFVSDENYKNIIVSLAENGIDGDWYEKDKKTDDKKLTFKVIVDGTVCSESELTFSYTCVKDPDPKTEKRLIASLTDLYNQKIVTRLQIEKIAATFSTIKKGHNIVIKYVETNYLKNTINKYSFDKVGFRLREEFKNNEKILEEKRLSLSKRKLTLFSNSMKIREVITDTSLNTSEEILYKYSDDNKIDCIKKTLSIKEVEDNVKQSVTFIYYKDNNPVQAKINDPVFGVKEYKFKKSKMAANVEGTVVIAEFDPVNIICKKEGLEHLKELGAIDGALIELEKNIKEIKIPYDKLFEKIYYEKTKTVIGLIKKREVIVYVGDKGNTCIYDKQGEKVAYLPRKSLGKLYDKIVVLPGVLVEQRIKYSDNVNDIKKVYWLGNQIGEKKGIYAFERVIRALCQNENTPSDILNDIAVAVLNGKYDYKNIVYIAGNKSTAVSTLQMIIDSKPSILVKDALDANPNTPKKLEELTDANEILQRVLKTNK